VKEYYTKSLAGHRNARLTCATLVIQRSERDEDLFERLDDICAYLKPHGADDETILSKTRFRGKPELWIPMAPH
jgi:hypothetical protein